MGRVIMSGVAPLLTAPTPPPCLTFSSPSAFSISAQGPGWDGDIEYSTDAITWNTWSGMAVNSVMRGTQYKLYFRGIGNTKISTGASQEWTLSGSNITCNGNIEYLLDYATVAAGNHPTMANYCYSHMFYNCANLVAAPALPATTLTEYCYRYMFDGCAALVAIPALPATILAYECYNSMFRNCTSLKLSTTQTGAYTKAYSIPASGIGEEAYGALDYMFSGTSGTFSGTPTINTTYYLDSSNSIVS